MNKRSLLKDRKSSLTSDKDFFDAFDTELKEKNNLVPTAQKESSIQLSDDHLYTRQTFMISFDQLDKLKDFVHTVRKNRDYRYSQKQAIQEALDLLFGTMDNIEKRT